jgi:hypothetical protein
MSTTSFKAALQSAAKSISGDAAEDARVLADRLRPLGISVSLLPAAQSPAASAHAPPTTWRDDPAAHVRGAPDVLAAVATALCATLPPAMLRRTGADVPAMLAYLRAAAFDADNKLVAAGKRQKDGARLQTDVAQRARELAAGWGEFTNDHSPADDYGLVARLTALQRAESRPEAWAPVLLALLRGRVAGLGEVVDRRAAAVMDAIEPTCVGFLEVAQRAVALDGYGLIEQHLQMERRRANAATHAQRELLGLHQRVHESVDELHARLAHWWREAGNAGSAPAATLMQAAAPSLRADLTRHLAATAVVEARAPAETDAQGQRETDEENKVATAAALVAQLDATPAKASLEWLGAHATRSLVRRLLRRAELDAQTRAASRAEAAPRVAALYDDASDDYGDDDDEEVAAAGGHDEPARAQRGRGGRRNRPTTRAQNRKEAQPATSTTGPTAQNIGQPGCWHCRAADHQLLACPVASADEKIALLAQRTAQRGRGRSRGPAAPTTAMSKNH